MEPPIAKGAGQRIAQLVPLHLCVALAGASTTTKGIFFSALLDELPLGAGLLSVFFASGLVMGAVTGIVAAHLIDTGVSIRPILVAIMLLIGGGYLVASLATNAALLAAGLSVMNGLAVTMICIPALQVMRARCGSGLHLGIVLAGGTTAGVVITPAIGFFVEGHGWRAGYLLLAALQLSIAAVLWEMLPRSQAAVPDDPAVRFSRRAVAAAGKAWLPLFLFTIYTGCSGTYLIHFVSLMEDRGMASGTVPFAMGGFFLTLGVSKILLGWLSDRVDRHMLLCLSFLVATLGFLVFGTGHSYATTMVANTLLGLSLTAPVLFMPLVASEYFAGPYQMRAYTFSLLVGTVLGAGVPMVVGYMFERQGSYDSAMDLLALLSLAAAASIFLARGYRWRRERRCA